MIGIRIAILKDFQYTLIRVVPIFQKNIYLKQRCLKTDIDKHLLWDAPIESSFNGKPEETENFANKIVGEALGRDCKGCRNILSYQSEISCDCRQNILLFAYPIKDFDEITRNDNKRFFTFDELGRLSESLSPYLKHELPYLQMIAEVWDHFDTPSQSEC